MLYLKCVLGGVFACVCVCVYAWVCVRSRPLQVKCSHIPPRLLRMECVWMYSLMDFGVANTRGLESDCSIISFSIMGSWSYRITSVPWLCWQFKKKRRKYDQMIREVEMNFLCLKYFLPLVERVGALMLCTSVWLICSLWRWDWYMYPYCSVIVWLHFCLSFSLLCSAINPVCHSALDLALVEGQVPVS